MPAKLRSNVKNSVLGTDRQTTICLVSVAETLHCPQLRISHVQEAMIGFTSFPTSISLSYGCTLYQSAEASAMLQPYSEQLTGSDLT